METANATVVNIFGGSFFGNLITALCFGVLTIQASSYYHAFPGDGKPLKLAVAFLWTVEAFQLACVTRALYWWLVPNYRNYSTLGRATWEFLMYQINTTSASVTVQTFFAHRVYSLSGNLYIGVLVQVLVLIQFGLGAATAVKANLILEFEVMVEECTWLVVSWLTIQAIADIVIAACMCVLLRHRRTGFRKTDSVINRMVLYTISTGLITSVVSCFLVAMFAKYGFHISEMSLGMPLGAIYSITMLANLHNRTTLRARLAAPSPLELVSSVKQRMRQNVRAHRHAHLNANIEETSDPTKIYITTEVVSDDVDIELMNGDTKVQFAAVRSPVFWGDLNSSPRFPYAPDE